MDRIDEWSILKKSINDEENKVLYKEGDVWWISIGQNIKTESFGKGENFRRPILVIKKLSNDNCIGIPLSTKLKEGSWFYQFDLQEIIRTALLYQVRMFNTSRFQRRIGQLDDHNFKEIKKRLKKLLNL